MPSTRQDVTKIHGRGNPKASRCHVPVDGIAFAFFRAMQTNSTEPSQSSANTPRDIVFQCPHCHTTLKLDRATEGTTLKCESCQQLIRVPQSRSAKKVSDQAKPLNLEHSSDLESCLKENESQRTEITGYINQLNIQLHRWQLRLQTLNERKQQLEAKLAPRKT
jgi:DNA-directed RNA polymerase subunit M/transcription elongation factor TFIIS